MIHRASVAVLATHTVTNQPPDFAPRDLWQTDPALREAVRREGGGWAEDLLAALGAEAGSDHVMELGDLANRNPPTLRAFDRHGHRLDEVEFHPAYHALMDLAFRHRIHAIPWTARSARRACGPRGYGISADPGRGGGACPVAMTYAAVPVLRRQPELAAEWLPRILSGRYDPALHSGGRKDRGDHRHGDDGEAGRLRRARQHHAGRPYGRGRRRVLAHRAQVVLLGADERRVPDARAAPARAVLLPRPPLAARRRPQRRSGSSGSRTSSATAPTRRRRSSSMAPGRARSATEGAGVATIIQMVHHTRLDCAIGAGRADACRR